MVIKNLSILNYKNIAQADLAFSDKINCFIGANGMGKTNVLDAVYYLSFCKTHRWCATAKRCSCFKDAT